MEMIYNELSNLPLAENRTLANKKVFLLIECYKKARQNGFDKIRFTKMFHEIEVAEGYTLQQWLDTTDHRNLKDLILGARTYPFIKPEDIWAEEEYILNHFYFENAEILIEKTECLGLAAAYLYNTIAVSFSESQIWERNTLSISKVNDETLLSEVVDVFNVFSIDCFEQNKIRTFIERIGDVILVDSILKPDEKPIHLRSDHGTDVLIAFAKQIRNNKHVNGIINSLPWNNRVTSFIRRVYPNGLIEVVLFWTDEGFGMVIQATGRNLRETQEIANILEEEYT